VRRFVHSDLYARAKLVSATVFIALGASVLVRTSMAVGLVWKALPAYVLGAAMIALGIVRYRDYLAAKARR
jgi:hypothetical protein